MFQRRYATVGLAIVLVTLTAVIFSDESVTGGPDYTGIVTDVREGSNGFTFVLNTVDGEIRCFHNVPPAELGYYGVSGNLSDDGGILFVDILTFLGRPYILRVVPEDD